MTSMRHRQSSLVNDLIDSRLTVESALQFFRMQRWNRVPVVAMMRYPSTAFANSMNVYAAAFRLTTCAVQEASAWRMPARCLPRGSGATFQSTSVIVRAVGE
ncbi:MAG: hypothetical protein C0183_19115 [Roseiflexus castenholzii]|nr:MAG: hypothetical protein C0183_19115 [Roseiflexus castenholzii]